MLAWTTFTADAWNSITTSGWDSLVVNAVYSFRLAAADYHVPGAVASDVHSPGAAAGEVGIGGEGFAPDQLAGIRVWFKAESLNLADNAAVASWADSSGLGIVAAQATGTQQPLYVASAINGKPAVRFDGVNDSLLFTTPHLDLTNKTIFVVGKARVSLNAVRLFLGNSSANYYVGGAGGNKTVTSHSNMALAQVFYSPTLLSFPSGQFAILSYRWSVSGPSVSVSHYIGGSLSGTLSNTQGHHPDPFNNWSLGALFSGDTANCWDGEIAELIVYDTALTDANRGKVENYLKQKYGI